MPLPPSADTGTVTGKFTEDDGDPARGKVYFVPPIPWLLDANDDVIVVLREHVAVLDVNGEFTQVLVATDDPDLNPIDWTWTVRIDLANKPAYHFDIDVPAGSNRDLADIAAIPPYEGTQVIAGPPGLPGSGMTEASTAEALTGTAADRVMTPRRMAAPVMTPAQSIATLNTRIDAMSTAGGGTIDFLPGTVFNVNAQIVMKSNVRLRGNGAILELDTGANAIQALGTETSKTNLGANHAAGVSVINLPAGQGAAYAAGDIIGLQSTLVVIPGVPGIRARELHRVMSVATDAITIDRATEWAFNTADTAQFWKITPVVEPVVEGFILRYKAGGTQGRGIVFDKVLRGRVDCMADGGPGVTVSESMSCDVKFIFDRMGNYSGASLHLGYGVTVAGSGWGNHVDVIGRDCRHVFTTLPLQVASDMWTGPYDTVVDGIGTGGPSSFATFDTHAGAVRTKFNIIADGPNQASTPAIQDRAYRTVIANPVIRGCPRGITTVADTSVGCHILGGVIEILPTSSGGCVNAAGDDGVIRGAHLIALAGYGVDNVGDRTLVDGCFIEAISCWRENAGVDTGAIFQNNTVKLSATAGFGGISTARGLQKNNTFIPSGSTSVFLSAPGASARLETGWHASTVVTYAASVTPNPPLVNNIRITLTGNITIANPATNNKVNGARLRVTTVQDATGGRTHTWGTDFKTHTAAVTTANLRNSWDFEFNGTNWVEVAATVGAAA